MKESDFAPFIDSAEDRATVCQRILALAKSAANANRPQEWTDGDGESRILRPLLQTEVETLKSRGNVCKEWNLIRLLLPNLNMLKDQSSRLEATISNNTFSGVVVIGLGNMNKEGRGNDHDLPAGIRSNGIISNCVLDDGCCVRNNTVLINTYVARNATVVDCGRVESKCEIEYGRLKLAVGSESGGGRDLDVFAESTMMDVCEQLGASCKAIANLPTSSSTLVSSPPCNWNIIGSTCLIRNSPTIENVYLAPNCKIEAASFVKKSVLLEGSVIRNGGIVESTLLQWNACVENHSCVRDTLMMERAHAGPQSMVASTILGPDVHVSCGEVHASVVGPNTNAHHQSLVISVLWPLGRGNIGYGANVGSNHTGRIPDQETCSGEGVFWGLTTCIKFPVDMSYAVYSVVAAGTTLVPQRITMPFSLLMQVEGGENQIVPGWVLQSSPYTIARSEAKYANRRKAVRHNFYTGWKIIRPDVIDMCVEARKVLLEATPSQTRWSGERELRGIGANVLTERGRKAGVKAYADCIQRYALRGLLSWLEARDGFGNLRTQLDLPCARERTSKRMNDVPSWAPLPWEANEAARWEHQRGVLLDEFPLGAKDDILSWVVSLLRKLVSLENDHSKRVHKCKQRDDTRGRATIPGYIDTHVTVEEDGVVEKAKKEAQQVAASANTLLELRGSLVGGDCSRSRL